MNKKRIYIVFILVLSLTSSIFFLKMLEAGETMDKGKMKEMKIPEGSGTNDDMKSAQMKKGGNMKSMKNMKMGGMDMKGTKQGTVMINMAKQQLIGVKKELVKKRHLEKIIRTVGKVEYDERRIKEVNLKVEGWIKNLYADYTGKYIRKGNPLFTFYSPQLLSTQKEYFLTLKGFSEKKRRHQSKNMNNSAKTKLLLWDVTEKQIKQLEESGKPLIYLSILSPISGFIISKSVLEGGYVRPGNTLFQIADLSNVWVYADIYEYELPFVKTGQVAMVTLSSQPGDILKGRVSYIYPYMEEKTRSVRVRLEFPNTDQKLKPGMFANVHIHADMGEQLSISEGAVLNTGLRQIVFIFKGNGMFEPRRVKLGNPIEKYYPVIEGLKEGEEIVSSANFLIDSESKLTASMEGMMGLLGMGDWKMESAEMGEMDMDMN